MTSSKRLSSHINLEKYLSVNFPDLLTTVIRETILTNSQMLLTNNTVFGHESTQIIANLWKNEN